MKLGVHVAGRNCGPFATQCIDSLRSQVGPEWHAVVIDDASDDDTQARCVKAIDGDQRVRLVRNKTRRYGCWNHNEACRILLSDFGLKADDLLVCLDLDDEFRPDCLRTVHAVHESLGDWVTYGNWQDENGAVHAHRGWTPDMMRTVRTLPWFLTHVLAMRVGIWRAVPKSFYGHDNGEPYQNGWDGATMYPAVDLAGPDRVSGISAPLYVHRKHHNAAVRFSTPKWFRDRASNAQRNKPRLKALASLEGTSDSVARVEIAAATP